MFLIRHPKNWGLDEEKVLSIAARVAEAKELETNSEISLLFLGRRRAKALNLSYRKMTYTPQVLAFPQSKEKDVDGVVHLGDVMICTPLLKAETVVQKQTWEEVLYSWFDHGIGNLLK